MQNGIKILVGNPDDEIPGQNIILPEHPSMIKAREVYLLNLKKSYIKTAFNTLDCLKMIETLNFWLKIPSPVRNL